MANESVGAIAQGMAAAPVERKEREQKRTNPLAKVWQLVKFVVPNKTPEAYVRDNGSTSQKLAHAVIRLADTDIVFNVNINRIVEKNGDTFAECTLPSKRAGAAFLPIFVANTPKAQAHLDEWRLGLEEAYVAHSKGEGKNDEVPTSTRQRVRL